MQKLDLKKSLKELYSPSARQPNLVTVPLFTCLMIDGTGDPNSSPRFQAACEALYGLSYTLKFSRKHAGEQDYAVMPLEGLWWCEDMSCFDTARKGDWLWTLLIVQPVPLSAAEFADLAQQVRRRKDVPELDEVRLERWEEGLCAQVMHIGPFSEEGPTVERLHEFIADSGCEPQGKHHEIYLSDPRRTAPEKLRTVLRQPVRRTQS